MLKYVRFLHATEGEVFAFTFAPFKHSDLAGAFRSQGYHPASAGFVSFDQDGTAHTHGESVSLRLKPDMGDAGRIGVAYRTTAAMQTADRERQLSAPLTVQTLTAPTYRSESTNDAVANGTH